MELLRSWMFVPGHRQRMIDKALSLDADAIMLDIEDGVAPNEKDSARQNIADSLGRDKAPGTPARYVRINAIGHARMDADLEAVVRPGLKGLVCPKVDTPEEVRTVDAILNQKEPANGLAKGSVKLLIAIESPRGLLNAAAIAAACPRIAGIMFGAEDFGREIGLAGRARRPSARSHLCALLDGHCRSFGACPGGGWRLGGSKRYSRASRIRQAVAPIGIFRHVVHSPGTNPGDQSNV